MIQRKLFFIIFLVLLPGWQVWAQVLTIVDQKNNKPIENVAVFNLDKTKSVVSDANGKADITSFSDEAFLTLQHPAYQPITLQKKTIDNPVIKLAERVIKMKDVVISANKWEQDASEIPHEIVSISAQEIAFNNPQTSADMLAQSGEIFMQKSQYGGGSPKLRGFAANSVLIVVDGVRMNNAIYRGGNLQNVINVDPNALAGAEVVLGPGSVIYGSDALGGVMDFHVKDPKYATDDQLRVQGTAFTRYSSASNERSLHSNFNIGGEKIAWFSSVSYSKFGDLQAGENRPEGYPDFGKKFFLVRKGFSGNDVLVVNPHPNTQSPSGFESWSTIQKVGFKPIPELEINYNFYLSNTSDIPRYDRLIETNEQGIPENAEWFYGPQKWVMNSLKATFTRPTSMFDQSRLIIARQDYNESRNDRKFGDDRLRTREEKVDIWSINLDLDKQFDHGNLFYGVEYLYNDITSSAERVNLTTGEITFPATRYPDGGSKYWSYAAYASHKWNISDLLVLTSGVRYSLVKLQANITDDSALDFPFNSFELENDAFNGSLGLVYNPSKNFKANVALSSGFRSPNIDDVGKVFDFSEGEVQVPNPQLQPEFSYNAEAGIEWMITDNFEIGATVFHTWVDDAMVRQDFNFNGNDSIVFDGELSKVVALQNTGSAVIYGYSFEMEVILSSRWALDASLTDTMGEDRTNNEPLRHTTPLFGQVSLLYQHEKLRAELYTQFNGNRFRADIPASEIEDKPFLYAMHVSDPAKDGSPGWYTLNFKAAYQINTNFSISGGVENILDRHYRPYSSGISAPGRNFILSVRGSF
ncbi:MAG: TonB-dependent receptor [Fulvivirga sp.]|nr:TonB-dependent receptor [Fulvivirga sp.]